MEVTVQQELGQAANLSDGHQALPRIPRSLSIRLVGEPTSTLHENVIAPGLVLPGRMGS